MSPQQRELWGENNVSSQSPLSKLQGYYQRKVASLFYRKPTMIRPTRPIVSFTFDDFPRSALAIGGSILEHFGLRGTYYVSLGLMGKEAPTGEMFVAEDLTALVARGHELGCHTFSHCNAWSADTGAFEDSIIQNRAVLGRLLPGVEFKTFSYPISPPRPLTKAKIADYFMCCRGSGQVANVGRADLNQLSAYFLEKTLHNIQKVKDLIDHNQEDPGWLIFATHDVSDRPTPFGCTPEFFEEVVQYAVNSGAQVLPVVGALQALGAAKSERASSVVVPALTPTSSAAGTPAKPLVSILIPAYNAQDWIADTLRSAIAQTWENKEIIVVDDGSTDETVAITRQFESSLVRVVSQEHQGAAAGRNKAFAMSHGDYIQWLDADDLLAPDKIALQMEMLDQCRGRKILVSSAFGRFIYRYYRAKFVPTALWCDLTPTEFLVRKMGENLFMQTATWLVSRELTEAAGPWHTAMLGDDDGEYFCRVLLASEGIRFVPEARVYYRALGYDSLSYIGRSKEKADAQWHSMLLHIDYLKSLEDSERVRNACASYLQNGLIHFYPDRTDILEQMSRIAADLNCKLEIPRLQWRYACVRALFGWNLAKQTQVSLRRIMWFGKRLLDKMLFQIQGHTLRRGLVTTKTQSSSSVRVVGATSQT